MDEIQREALKQLFGELIDSDRDYEVLVKEKDAVIEAKDAIIAEKDLEIKEVCNERDSYKTEIIRFHADRDINIEIDFVPEDEQPNYLNATNH